MLCWAQGKIRYGSAVAIHRIHFMVLFAGDRIAAAGFLQIHLTHSANGICGIRVPFRKGVTPAPIRWLAFIKRIVATVAQLADAFVHRGRKELLWGLGLQFSGGITGGGEQHTQGKKKEIGRGVHKKEVLSQSIIV